MRNSIRTRLAIAFVALAAGLLILVGTVLAWQSYITERQQALILESEVVQRISIEVTSYIQAQEKALQFLIQIQDLSNLNRDQQTQLLSSLLSYSDSFDKLVLVDRDGRELVAVSRTETHVQLGDRSAADEYKIPKSTGQTYYSPVRFTETTGEPLLTIAMPTLEVRSGVVTGILIADIRFRPIWNLLASIPLGEGGSAYIVDSQNRVIAHTNPSVVLRNTSFVVPGQDGVYPGLNNTDVVLATDRIIFGEQKFILVSDTPLAEAFASLINTELTIVALLLIGMVVAGGLGLIAARQIVRPIEALVATAQTISAGDLSHQAQITRDDEIGSLAKAFNSMTAQLRDLIGSLELRVAERTAELTQRSRELEKLNLELETATRQAERRAAQLAASTQVARAISQVRDLDELLSQVTRLISDTFDYYHVGIFTKDELGRFAVLRAASSEGGQRMLTRGHKLIIGQQGIVGYVTGAGQPHVALDVGADATHFDNPDLPDTRSEMALPLRVGDQIFGALDIQSLHEAAFTKEDVTVLAALADQIVIAIENARLFAQSQAALQEAEKTARHYQRQEWDRLTSTLQTTSYEYHISGVPAVGNAPLPEIEQAIRQGKAVVTKSDDDSPVRAAVAVPIKLRDQVVGIIDLHETDTDRNWTEDDIAILTAVADQAGLALENVRLIEETERLANRERIINKINARVRQTVTIDSILEAAVTELGRSLTATHVFARVGRPETTSERPDQTG